MSDKNEAPAKKDDQSAKDTSAPKVHKLSDQELGEVAGGAAKIEQQGK